MGYLKIKSYAKINLALNVVGKTFKLHKIESIISFLDLHDEISIKNIENKKVHFKGIQSELMSSANTLLEKVNKL